MFDWSLAPRNFSRINDAARCGPSFFSAIVCPMFPPSLDFTSHALGSHDDPERYRDISCCDNLWQHNFLHVRRPIMAQNTSSVPSDLASILATLSQFAAPVQSYNTASDVVIQQDVRKDSDYDPYDAYEPPALEASRQLSESRTPQSQPSVIDPATITEWSAGLRCVSKVAAQNRQFADTIKRVPDSPKT